MPEPTKDPQNETSERIRRALNGDEPSVGWVIEHFTPFLLLQANRRMPPEMLARAGPEDLVNEIEKCKDNVAAKQVGIEWGIQQSKELMEYGVPVLHYYSMGKSESVYKIAKELF